MGKIGLRLRCALVASATLLAVLVAAAPATAASPTTCRVKNLDTGVTKTSLQKAVWQARPGQRLAVRGTCKGTTTIGKDLTIRGVRTATSGEPILDGATRGTVITVKARVKVRLRHLTVQRGAAQTGGGILNQGTLVLRDVVVRANSAAYGGGAYNFGILKLNGSSSIRANSTANPGVASAAGTLAMNETGAVSSLPLGACSGGRADLTPGVSGGGVLNANTLTLNGSSTIRGNGTDIWGGGVYNAGTLTLNDASAIRGNSAGATGGGVYNEVFGTLMMDDSSSIQGNTAIEYEGGGVCNLGTLDPGVVCAGNVHDNMPDDCAP